MSPEFLALWFGLWFGLGIGFDAAVLRPAVDGWRLLMRRHGW